MLTQYKFLLDPYQGGSSLVTNIQHILSTHQSRDAFIKLIRNYFLQGSYGYNLIMQAYDETLRDFESKQRDGGTAFFGHPEAVAIILIVYMGVRDPNIVVAAILHDNMEDLSHLGWTYERVSRTYNDIIAKIVLWMTKAKVSEYGGDKVRRDSAYHECLFYASKDVVLVKLIDRFHNTFTLDYCPLEKQGRKLEENRKVYLTLAYMHNILYRELLEITILQEIKLRSKLSSST